MDTKYGFEEFKAQDSPPFFFFQQDRTGRFKAWYRRLPSETGIPYGDWQIIFVPTRQDLLKEFNQREPLLYEDFKRQLMGLS